MFRAFNAFFCGGDGSKINMHIYLFDIIYVLCVFFVEKGVAFNCFARGVYCSKDNALKYQHIFLPLRCHFQRFNRILLKSSFFFGTVCKSDYVTVIGLDEGEIGMTDAEKKKLFSLLERIAEAIVHTFGPHSEVAVHDLADPNRSLVHIAGNVTGRSVGSPVSNFGLKMFALREKGEDVHGFQTKYKDKSVVSSTVSIKDEQNRVVGLLCINFDITTLRDVQQAIAGYGLQHLDLFGPAGLSFADLNVKTVESVVNDVLAEMKKNPRLMNAWTSSSGSTTVSFSA